MKFNINDILESKDWLTGKFLDTVAKNDQNVNFMNKC